jgi:hypothetical protein
MSARPLVSVIITASRAARPERSANRRSTGSGQDELACLDAESLRAA